MIRLDHHSSLVHIVNSDPRCTVRGHCKKDFGMKKHLATSRSDLGQDQINEMLDIY